MKATDELRNEHEGIELMLRILQAVSAKVEHGEEVEARHFDGILEFLSIFVDRCHHGKEAEFLFPAFESVGAAQERDLIGVLMKEHEEGRKLVAQLEDAVKRWRSGEKTGERSVKDTLNEYATLLTQHIAKENTHLFPMVEMKLDSDTDNRLFEAFENLETERIGLGKHEEFHALLHRLRDTCLT